MTCSGHENGDYVAGGRLEAAVGHRCEKGTRRRTGVADGPNMVRKCGCWVQSGATGDGAVAGAAAAVADAAADAAAADDAEEEEEEDEDAADASVEEREIARWCWRMETLSLIVWDPLPTWTVMIRWKIPPDL